MKILEFFVILALLVTVAGSTVTFAMVRPEKKKTLIAIIASNLVIGLIASLAFTRWIYGLLGLMGVK